MLKARASAKGLVETFRRQILDGAWAPDMRLPTRMDLIRRYGASSATVQKAMTQLLAEGYIVTRGRAGSFVNVRPPHLHGIGLVLPYELANFWPWSRCWTAMLAAAHEAMRIDGCHITTYLGVNGARTQDGAVQLIKDIKAHRVAGLIIAVHLDFIRRTPILDEPGIARVILANGDQYVKLPRVRYGPIWGRVMQYLRERRHRRVALVHNMGPGGLEPGFVSQWERLVHDNKLETHPTWLIPVFYSSATTARYAVHLLLNRPAADRPDALIIDDDNLVEESTAGVQLSGLRVPEEIEVVAHCNFPAPPQHHVPVRFVGFDARQVLRLGMDLLLEQRMGREVAPLTTVEPLMGDEVPPYDLPELGPAWLSRVLEGQRRGGQPGAL